jgi:drug/metabolite transporter (DMT)-like permease
MPFPAIRHILAVAGLSGAVLLGGCQNPDGSTNWGNTLLLGAGVGTAAALVAGAAADQPRHYGRGYGRGPAYGYYAPRPAYGYGYGPGYYRGW